MIVKPLKAKKCKVCKEPFIPPRPLAYICSTSCAVEMTKLNIQKNRHKKIKEETKVMREKIKTLTDYEKEAKGVFQKWVRMRDFAAGYNNCISCGTPITLSKADGSHFYDANKFSGGIFNPMNCHASCQQCNRFFHGALLGYRDGLIARYGIDYINNLESLKDGFRNYKYSKEELIGIKAKYLKLIKELE